MAVEGMQLEELASQGPTLFRQLKKDVAFPVQCEDRQAVLISEGEYRRFLKLQKLRRLHEQLDDAGLVEKTLSETLHEMFVMGLRPLQFTRKGRMVVPKKRPRRRAWRRVR